MKKFFLLFLITISCALVACQRSRDYETHSIGTASSIVPFYEGRPMDVADDAKEQISHVGMLLPLSGKNKAVADDLRNAAILAQFELAGEGYTLSFYDTKGTDEGTVEAFNQAVNENVELILGPLSASEVEAIHSLSFRHNIPVFSFTSDQDKLGGGIYSLALTIPNQTERIIRFACEKGARRLAIMAPDNKAGDLAIDTAKDVADSCGMEITKLAVYNPTFINFEPYVLSVLPENFVEMRKEKIAEKKRARLKKGKKEKDKSEEETPLREQLEFDALFIADEGNRLKSISSLFGLYDIYPEDVLFLGLSKWYEPSLSNEGSLKGAYFPLLPEQGHKVFSEKFADTYGKKPSRLASLAYDAVALSVALTSRGSPNLAILNTRVGFLGTDGLFRFTKNGSAERLMSVYKIAGPQNFVRVERPSASFAIEDWKKEQLQDIKIINKNTDELIIEEIVEEESPDFTSTSVPVDSTSTSLP